MAFKNTEKLLLLLKNHYKENFGTELNYINNYTLLIAVLLSAQATDKGVNKATNELFAIATTPKEILNLGEEKLKNYLKSINYYNNKTKNIIKLSDILVNDFNSVVPNTRENLEKLPGVGRKTANIILNTAFNQPNIAVDTHVFRVSNRIGLVQTTNVLDTEMELYKVIPNKYIPFINEWFVLLGRYVCKARKPDCKNCFVSNLCKKMI